MNVATYKQYLQLTTEQQDRVQVLLVINENENTEVELVLPKGLKILRWEGGNFRVLPVLPEGLLELEVINVCEKPIAFPHTLPSTLKRLNVKNCNLKVLPILPDGLLELKCSMNSLVLPCILPKNLLKLNCSNCALESLPVLPTGLLRLQCDDNDITTEGYPKLPSTLIEFCCSHNCHMTTLPKLPESLLVLKCESKKLKLTKDQLPESLRFLVCYQPSQYSSLEEFKTIHFTERLNRINDSKLSNLCCPNGLYELLYFSNKGDFTGYEAGLWRDF
jgi:hypothetical protein